MVTTGAAVHPSEMAGRVNGSAVLRFPLDPFPKLSITQSSVVFVAGAGSNSAPVQWLRVGLEDATWGANAGRAPESYPRRRRTRLLGTLRAG